MIVNMLGAEQKCLFLYCILIILFY